METTVDKLEAMFQKSEADLEYIEKRLKLDFISNKTNNGGPAGETPVMMLENLRSIRAKHSALCSQVKEITAGQKESMDYITNSLGSAVDLMRYFQQATDMEVPPAIEAFIKQQPLGDTPNQLQTWPSESAGL